MYFKIKMFKRQNFTLEMSKKKLVYKIENFKHAINGDFYSKTLYCHT